jgi:Zn-dependent protease with chaperone function
MNPFNKTVELQGLPVLKQVNILELWEQFPLTPVKFDVELLDYYLERHDSWTEKIRVIGLDAGIIVDYRTMPGLDRIFDRIYGRSGWARPDIFVVSDIGRRGIDGWSAVSVVSKKTRPIILMGIHLIESLSENEIVFIIGHETAHLLCYSTDWGKQMSLSFLIREYIESNRLDELEQMDPKMNWEDLYRAIMQNMRAMEIRCDLLGLLLCGDLRAAATALLTAVLKSPDLARQISIDNYLKVQWPLLSSSPAAGPFIVNAGHPFVPYRLKYLSDFVASGQMDHYIQKFSA